MEIMMKKIVGLIGVSIYLVVCATQSFAFDLEWKTKADMLTGRKSLAAAALNGKIYAIGGLQDINIVEEFDPTVGPNGTWATKTPMSTGRAMLSAVALNGKMYAIGGYVYTGIATNVVEEFDPTVGPNGTWTRMANMPTARYGFGAVALNGKIYAIGGMGGANVVEEFDPTVGPDGTWTTKAPIPNNHGMGVAAAVLNGKIYTIGGDYSYNLVQEFDPTVGSNGTWTRMADMPTGRWALAAAVLNGKIYTIGGLGTVEWKIVEEFDPTVGPNGTWTRKANMLTGRNRLAAAALNGKIYAIGGEGGLNVVEEATLGAPVNTNVTNGGDAGTLTIADAKGDAILTYSGMGGTKTVTCAATKTTILQGYGIGYLATPKDQAVMPMATVYYNYEVSNSSNGTDTIAVSVETLSGATWTASLIDDTNQDGFHQETENTPLASPLTLRQNEGHKFFLKVDVSIAGSATIRVRAQSSQSDSWGDIDMRYDETLTFALGYGVRLSSPVDLTGSPSTTVYYPYRVTNSGNATDTITLSATNIAGGTWALTVLQDDN